jgi:monofunctional chorismate mutase
MQKLRQLRKSIDRIDDHILDLLNRRMKLVADVGNLKAKSGDRVYDRSREKQILARICGQKKSLVKDKDLRIIYKKIMAVSRQYQRTFFKK